MKIIAYLCLLLFLAVAVGMAIGQSNSRNSRANIKPAPTPSVTTTPYSAPVDIRSYPPSRPPENLVLDVTVSGAVVVMLIIAGFFIYRHKQKQNELERERIARMTPAQRQWHFEQKERERKELELARRPKPIVKPPDEILEYRRTCLVCGKVWHSLVSRENQIASSAMSNSLMACGGGMQNCGTCGLLGGGTAAQASRSIDANQSDLQRLKSCPECHSANYREETVKHVR